jgi:hypothetical protein
MGTLSVRTRIALGGGPKDSVHLLEDPWCPDVSFKAARLLDVYE